MPHVSLVKNYSVKLRTDSRVEQLTAQLYENYVLYLFCRMMCAFLCFAAISRCVLQWTTCFSQVSPTKSSTFVSKLVFFNQLVFSYRHDKRVTNLLVTFRCSGGHNWQIFSSFGIVNWILLLTVIVIVFRGCQQRVYVGLAHKSRKCLASVLGYSSAIRSFSQ